MWNATRVSWGTVTCQSVVSGLAAARNSKHTKYTKLSINISAYNKHIQVI